MKLSLYVQYRENLPNKLHVLQPNSQRKNRPERLRRTHIDEHIVLHVQYDMRTVRHDFGVQNSGGSDTFGNHSPVVGVELRR